MSSFFLFFSYITMNHLKGTNMNTVLPNDDGTHKQTVLSLIFHL